MIDLIKLDENSRVPKYLQIIDSIIHNISIGNTSIGDKIPSINKLSEECYLSRDTVEKAYNVLKKRKVIVSVHGKGTYIAKTQSISKLNILFLVNKLSPYKLKIYESFMKTLGDKAQTDFHSYHCDETLFLELLEKYKSSYDYFVVMPHFRTENLSHTSFTGKIKEALKDLPQESLLIMDDNQHQLEGEYKEVYQDFENDIYNALKSGIDKISKYDKLTLVYPNASFYPYPRRILKGFTKFCGCHGFDFEVIEEVPENIQLAKGNLFLTIEEEDLVSLVNQVRDSQFKLGSDIGIISYNDTALKELLGITVVSADFFEMGSQAAKMIISNNKDQVKVPFDFIDRASA